MTLRRLVSDRIVTRMKGTGAYCLALSLLASVLHAQGLEVPRRHDRPPGPPIAAEEAVAKMTVPEGFTVEIVAAEPDVVNPVAMFIDEKGRYWITESFEYPRKEPGPGRDRIKVLEDTDGDGKVDNVTVFAEGLNIPSGIAVGHGGVWVANSPDILFLQDTDGDLKADKQEVIVTGFGRTDTHELPNSFTWGPDGWLYGLNGVFNYCDVKYSETNPNFSPDQPGWKFTCAMWRIHPRTREFQVFAEGTSNPWGIAINDEGEFFISACVIDHLWHIVESAYYIRQGGPYPAHTWPMRSIVEHKHQKAAYCGITWFDSDCYPEEYRKVLYMGNIHGGCINADVVERSGSTYRAKPHPGFAPKPGAWDDDEYDTIAKTGDENDPKLADLLTANDPWFMPVVQTTGPDGCLYVLDWYDRYHCYQDANADPAGIERERGRLYRLRYKDTPHAPPFDLSTLKSEKLVELLATGGNEYLRSTSRRLLAERLAASHDDAIVELLVNLVDPVEGDVPAAARLQALWTLASAELITEENISVALSNEQPPAVYAWGLRLAADALDPETIIGGWGFLHLLSEHPQVRLQSIIAASKLKPEEGALSSILLGASGKPDPLIQHVAWQNLHPLIERQPGVFVEIVATLPQEHLSGIVPMLPRAIDRLIGAPGTTPQHVSQLLEWMTAAKGVPTETTAHLLRAVGQRMLSGKPSDGQTADYRDKLEPIVAAPLRETGHPLQLDAAILAGAWGDQSGTQILRRIFYDRETDYSQRIRALQTLIALREDRWVLSAVSDTINAPNSNAEFRVRVIEQLGGVKDTATGGEIAKLLVDNLPQWEAEVRPKAIEILTQRPAWSKPLLAAVQAKQINKDALNLNQLRRIATFKDDTIQKSLAEIYGEIREGRDPNRENVFYKMRDFLRHTPGDPLKGEATFKKVCGQCHKLYGEGAEVGPDITRNGRNNWEQLLWNLFDPSQVIGPGYQARILVTSDGRTLTGLPVEESEEQVVLKVQGGKQETIARDDIEVYKVSELSMMPDQLEKQITPQELADLLSFLAHDKHPSDPEAKLLPGAPDPRR